MSPKKIGVKNIVYQLRLVSIGRGDTVVFSSCIRRRHNEVHVEVGIIILFKFSRMNQHRLVNNFPGRKLGFNFYETVLVGVGIVGLGFSFCIVGCDAHVLFGSEGWNLRAEKKTGKI